MVLVSYHIVATKDTVVQHEYYTIIQGESLLVESTIISLPGL